MTQTESNLVRSTNSTYSKKEVLQKLQKNSKYKFNKLSLRCIDDAVRALFFCCGSKGQICTENSRKIFGEIK